MDDNLIFLNNMNYPISSLVTNTSTETDGIQGPGLGQAHKNDLKMNISYLFEAKLYLITIESLIHSLIPLPNLIQV
jgi:hypothetical protein